MRHKLFGLAILAAALLLAGAAVAQDVPPPAEIVNDEGGPVVVRGELVYTNPFFTAGVAQPVIILEDQSGFVNRQLDFVFSPESQVAGAFTSDFFSSPVTYTIPLPIEPQGQYNDVDQDSEAESGVQVYAIAYWTNTFGAPTLEKRDQQGGGWSTAYASTVVDATTYEYEGGIVLVYAPDDTQGFPSGFGDDGLLFSEDDPIVTLPAGYTVVDMNTDPFTFDRSREVRIDTVEPEVTALTDFSSLSYTEAFDAMIEKFRNEYAFTEYKELDWDAISAEFRPRFEEAEANNDADAYAFALRDFAWSIPDGHVSASQANPLLEEEFAVNTAGGLGMAIAELDDGRVIVSFILPDGPAAEAGISLGTEILEINGEAVGDVISATVPYSSPFSTDHARRLQQLRYAIRFPLDTEVEVTFQNTGDSDASTVTLTTVQERQSFAATSFFRGVTGTEPPVTYSFLPEGYGYAKIWDFLGNEVLTVQLWETFISLAIQQGVPGVIIDMRQNGGGNGFLAEQLAGYFFEDETIVGYTAFYDEDTKAFVTQTARPDRMYPPEAPLRYGGEVVVLVGPACASACESFAYAASIDERAAIVGQYPTAGLGGSVEDFLMPEGATIRFTIGRGLDANEDIHIEGIGVVPDVDVPVTPESVLAVVNGEDPVLAAGIAYLNQTLGLTTDSEAPDVGLTDGGEIAIGDTVEGEIAAGERVRYLLTAEADATIDINLTDADGALDTYLRVYDAEETLITENDDIQLGVKINSQISGLAVAAGDTLIIEVATFGDQLSGSYALEVAESE
jgi:C-terminal processing protease CtpA/Prc